MRLPGGIGRAAIAVENGDCVKGSCMLDASDRVVAHDDAFGALCAAHGLRADQLIEKRLADLLGTKEPGPFDFDGSHYHLSRVALPTMREAHQSEIHEAVVTACVITDLGPRHRIEAQLREAEDAFWALVESSPIGIVVIGPDQRVLLWSSAAEAIFGWSRSEVIGQPYPLVPPDKRQEFEQLFERVIAGEGFTRVEAWRAHKDGRRILLAVSTAPLRSANGDVLGAMALLTDRTEQHNLEQQLQRAARMEAVGRLAGGVAHDFNNLLTVVLANSHLLRRAIQQGNAQTNFVDEIEHCADRARDLTAQLLTFGRGRVLGDQATNIADVVEPTTRMLRRLIGTHVELVVETADDLPVIGIAEGQLEQLLLNLVVNARDAMPDGGRITIKFNTCEGANCCGAVREAGIKGVCLCVCDTGSGIEPSALPHIFDPFFTTKAPGEGTGLGLATVYGIVDQAGGAIDVDSKLGRGTCFRLRFPAMAGDLFSDVSTAADSPRARDGAAKLVLVVDDDDLVRRATCALLGSFGYTVRDYASGAEALAACAKNSTPIDVVLTDVYMPKMNGRQFADALGVARPNVPVVFMSGNLDDEILRGRVDSGAASFIAKPMKPTDLARTIDEAVERGRIRGEE